MRRVLALAAVLAPACFAAAQSRTVDLHLTEGTNIAAALSPDGSTFAFDLLGRIWVMPRAGGAARALTAPLDESRQPAWSPDGKRIAFMSYRTGTWHIWSMAKDGSEVRQHTFGQFDDREPEYTNEGNAIIFSSDRAGNYDLWRVDLASGAYTQLTNDPADDYAPSVNRSNGDIAFVSARAPAGGVYVLRADGRTVRWATSPNVPNAPSWSPDGTRLAWTALGTDTARLMIAMQDSTPRALSPADGDAFPFRPVWLANDALVYTGDGVIHTISTEGAVRASIPFDARVTFTRTAYAKRARDFEGKKPAKAYGIVEPALSPVW